MVNQNQGKEYNPKKFYNRKLLREIIRRRGYESNAGNVNKRMAFVFKQIREGGADDQG